ncbi:MAG TPA: hypothetical protein VL404_02400 [Candidatus Eisenbacteria bacterium]|nr:hypothetical protein [Candidatus Eisenbacteria bacterium]
MRAILLILSVLFFLPPDAAFAAVDAGSEERRFEDEQLYRDMQARLESDSVPQEDLIRFADEPGPAGSPSEPKKKSLPRKQ